MSVIPAPSSTSDSTYEPDIAESFILQALWQNSIIGEFTQRRIYNQVVPEEATKPYCVIQFLEGADDLAGALRRLRSRLRYRVTLVADGRSFQRLSVPAQQLDAALDARAEELPAAKIVSVRMGLWSYADKQLGREFVERGADYVISIQRRSAPASVV